MARDGRRADDECHAAAARVDEELGRAMLRIAGRHAIGNRVIDEHQLDFLGVVGDQLDADVAVLRRPSGGDAADKHRREFRQFAQPCQRLLALAPQRDHVLVAAEQRVMGDKRSLDLVVTGKRRAVGQHQLP